MGFVVQHHQRRTVKQVAENTLRERIRVFFALVDDSVAFATFVMLAFRCEGMPISHQHFARAKQGS